MVLTVVFSSFPLNSVHVAEILRSLIIASSVLPALPKKSSKFSIIASREGCCISGFSELP
jgi:hypothetical protein